MSVQIRAKMILKFTTKWKKNNIFERDRSCDVHAPDFVYILGALIWKSDFVWKQARLEIVMSVLHIAFLVE
jgi:hypothetical protein